MNYFLHLQQTIYLINNYIDLFMINYNKITFVKIVQIHLIPLLYIKIVIDYLHFKNNFIKKSFITNILIAQINHGLYHCQNRFYYLYIVISHIYIVVI